MNTKGILAMNFAWAALAAGAFMIGRGSLDDRSGDLGSSAGGSSSELAGGGVSGLPQSLASNRTGKGMDGVGESAGDDSSPEAAGRRMSSALVDPDPIRRKARVAELLLNLNPANVDQVLAAFEEAPKNDETDRHFRDFLYAWGRIGGEAAVAYATDPESPRRGRWGSSTAVAGWAAADLEGAKNYVAGVENVDSRQWMHYSVMREMMRSDLDGAIAYSEQNVKSRARGVQMDRLANEILAQRGMAGLTCWLAEIDHSEETNDLLSYKKYATSIVLDRMATEDPDSVSQFIADNAREPFLTSDGLERAARRAAGPINEELDWLANLPNEVAGQRHAIGERFEDFIREDFAAAGQWLASQPLGASYDEAIQDYAYAAARDDQDAAVAWAEQIADENLRAETLRRVAPKDPFSS